MLTLQLTCNRITGCVGRSGIVPIILCHSGVEWVASRSDRFATG